MGCQFLHQGIFLPRDRTCLSCVGRWILYHWATREAIIIIENKDDNYTNIVSSVRLTSHWVWEPLWKKTIQFSELWGFRNIGKRFESLLYGLSKHIPWKCKVGDTLKPEDFVKVLWIRHHLSYVCESCSVESDSLWHHGLYSPWNSPGQNTGVGILSLLQGLFLTQGLNPGLPRCRQILYQPIHKGINFLFLVSEVPTSYQPVTPTKLCFLA